MHACSSPAIKLDLYFMQVFKEHEGETVVKYRVGTMMEVPRACVRAEAIATNVRSLAADIASD